MKNSPCKMAVASVVVIAFCCLAAVTAQAKNKKAANKNNEPETTIVVSVDTTAHTLVLQTGQKPSDVCKINAFTKIKIDGAVVTPDRIQKGMTVDAVSMGSELINAIDLVSTAAASPAKGKKNKK